MKIKSFIITMCLVCVGCSPKIIEHEVVKHDTTYIEKLRRDSIYMHDSIYVHEYTKGDTVYRERDRWHYAWRDRLVHDSLYFVKTDSVFITKTREIEHPISGWMWFQIWAGRIAIFLVGLLLIWMIIKHKYIG